MTVIDKIQEALGKNKIEYAISLLASLSIYHTDALKFEARFNEIRDKEIKGTVSDSKLTREKNKLISNFLDFTNIIKKNVKDDENGSESINDYLETKIEEPFLEKFEKYLRMKKDKFGEELTGTYLKSHCYLLKMKSDVELLREKIFKLDVNSTGQVNSLMGDLTIVRKKIKEWQEDLKESKNENANLYSLLDDIKQRIYEVETERVKIIMSKSKSNLPFLAKISSLNSILNSINSELEIWIGFASKYRQN